jgi:uncharacterized membrane protein YdjX (TVP38/TMEM64 family)
MRSRLVLRIAAAVALIAGLALLYHFLPIGVWLTAFHDWVRGLGAIGYVVYVLVYALCCVLLVPAAILTLGAGALFGLAGGTVVVVIGATLGATLAFLLARTVLRRRVEVMTAGNAKFRALDRAIAREGGKIVLLCRLAIVFPFTFINYAFGLTGVRLGPYVLATFVGIIPGTFAFVWIGSLAHEAATASRVRLIVYAVGAVLALAASIFVGRLASRAIRQAGVEE